MDERLGRPYSDGSFWKTNLRCVDPAPCPSEGILKIDLTINETCMVVSVDEDGNCRAAEEMGLFLILSRSQQFPGTMRRADYYDRLLTWFCSLPLPHQVDTELAYEFTDRLVEYVFGKINPQEERMAIHVITDLNLVSFTESVPFEPELSEPEEELEQDQIDDETMIFEDDDEYVPPEPEEELEQDQIDDETMIFEDDDEYVPAQEGLSEGELEELLEEYTFDATVEDDQSLGDCSICLDDLVTGGEEDYMRGYLFKSPCCHVFHEPCIAKWLKNSLSCPLCRFIIPSELFGVLEEEDFCY